MITQGGNEYELDGGHHLRGHGGDF